MQQMLEPEAAATLFVERLIYQRQEQAFTDNFVDGAEIGERLDEFDEILLQDLTTAFSGTGGKMTPGQIKDLSEHLMQHMKINTTYQVKEIIEIGEETTIIYEVNGLDFVSVIKNTIKQLSERMLADLEFAQDDQKIAAAVTEILKTNIAEAQLVAVPTEMPLVLRKKHNKWAVPDDQQEAVINLMLTFATGAKDQLSLNQAISEASRLALEELTQAE